jgi:uncharacterized protein (DUF427 family)
MSLARCSPSTADAPQSEENNMDARMKTPGPDHPITVTRSDAHVVVRAGDQVIADSTRTLALQESTYPVVHYVPVEDVNRAALVPTDTATYCPYKGDASYYSVIDGPKDAVWEYVAPYPAVAQIGGYVAFYADRVTVDVQ